MSPRAERISGHVVGALVGVLGTVTGGILLGAVHWGGAEANAATLTEKVNSIDARVTALERSQGEQRTYLVALVCKEVPSKCPLDHAP